MFEYKKPLPFPCVYGVLDDGSDKLARIRNRLSFKSAIRFVTEPSILEKFPSAPIQVTVGIITPETQDAWMALKDIKLSLGVVINNAKFNKEQANAFLSDTIISQSSILIENAPIIVRVAYLLSITHLALPHPMEIDYSQYLTLTDYSVFPETIWVTNLFKNKNYDDRKVILGNMRNMISNKQDGYDEFVMFGKDEYTSKLISDSTSDYVKTVNVDTNSGVCTIGTMMRWIFKTYPPNTIVFMVRHEATKLPFSTLPSVTRIHSRTFAAVHPFVIPDVPDPRPELYQRGDPRVLCGYVFKMGDSTNIPDIFEKCSLYTVNHQEIVMSEMMKNHYAIGNGSRQVAIGYPNLKTLVLDRELVKLSMGVICPEIQPCAYIETLPNCPGKPSYTIKADTITIPALRGMDGKGQLETKTLYNMANKTMSRANIKTELQFLDKDTPMTGSQLSVYSGKGYRFKRNHWSDNAKMVAQDYWGIGVKIRDTSFIHKSAIFKNCIVLPRVGDSPNSFLNLLTNVLLQKTGKQLIIDSTLANEKIVLDSLVAIHKQINIQTYDFAQSNNFGGENCEFVISPKRDQSLGFSPSLARIANRKHQSVINVDLDTMKMLGEVNGLILDGKFAETILGKVSKTHENVKWTIVKGLSVEQFSNASYIIGMREPDSNVWIGTLFANHEHCKVIEIANEHDTNSSWYMLASGIGMDYNVLPLKNEPKKKCIKRITKHIKDYL